ncbi:MAG: family 10 glycosylhydrolase [candidate division KSB1 bacterium]|nr:family 10 glycosylhydrolase [candidate division KSB1 bacterium]
MQHVVWFSLLLLAVNSAHSQSPLDPEVRAIWVTRWEYRSPQDIQIIMKNIASARFNTVLFQVRGNATAFYESDIEPWASELGGEDPGWDPMAVALREAHARGLKLHVWINIGPGWRGKLASTRFEQLWNRHPGWFARDLHGNFQRLQSHYLWLALTHPEVRRYLAGVVMEIVRKYQPDGVHFDYIRFPGPGFSYDPASLQAFQLLTGLRPQDAPAAWDDFRRDAITRWLSMIQDSLAQLPAKPVVSAAVWRIYELGRNVFFQDSHHWLRAGLVDFIFPMTYTPDPDLFASELQAHLDNVPANRVVAGINPSRDPKALHEIQIAREKGAAGISVFSYSGLFKEHQIGALAKEITRRYFQKKVLPLSPTFFPADVLVKSVSTWPAAVAQKQPFFILAEIQRRKPASVRAFVVWKNPLPMVELVPLPGAPGKFISSRPVLLSDYEQWLEFRVAVTLADTPGDTSYSEWQHLPVGQETVPDFVAEEFDIPIGGAQFIAADARGNLWVPSWWENRIYVFGPDGTQRRPFSPISAGLDSAGNAVAVYRPGGIACVHGDTIVVAGNANRPVLLRFLAHNGVAIPGIGLPFAPYDVDASNLGELFVTEAGSGNWYHFTPDDSAGKHLPVPGGHLLRGIAVSPDGLTVYAACQVEGTVHQWQRLNALATFSHVPDLDVEAPHRVCGRRRSGQYLCEPHRTGICNGKFDLGRCKPRLSAPCRPRPLAAAPRGVAVTAHGVYITQMGGTTGMPLMKLTVRAEAP